MIITLGEAIVDFISSERFSTLAQSTTFVMHPGGAPANVAVGLARLGIRSGIVTKLGDDPFGRFLKHELEGNGVNTAGVSYTQEGHTGIAFVSVSESGERGFLFYKRGSSDEFLRIEDLDEEYLRFAKTLHLGSVSLAQEPARSATFGAVQFAKQAGSEISIDANLRLSLWQDDATARETVIRAISTADIVKASSEEARFILPDRSEAEAIQELLHMGPQLVVVTDGPAGGSFGTPNSCGRFAAYDVDVEDTLGAGDGFMAGLLAGVSRTGKPVASLSRNELEYVLCYAAASGACVARARGAMSGLPRHEAVLELLESQDLSVVTRNQTTVSLP